MATNMATKISIQDLGLFHSGFQALHRISLEASENQITVFIGPSDCERSTCLKTLNRMSDVTAGCHIEGKVSIDEGGIYDPRIGVSPLRRRADMVFQKPNPSPMNVYNNIAYGPRVHGVKSESQSDQIVEKSLRSAALWNKVKDRLKKSALGLSGGQQQRLCITHTLAVDPDILLMNEPTGALDPIFTQKIEDLFSELRGQYTVIIATHDIQQTARISDRTAFFLLGEVVEFTETKLVFEQPKDGRTERYITGRFG